MTTMKMRPAQGVSFPRSGHAAVANLAFVCFGDLMIYCDTNNKNACGCDSVPCVNPARTFAKNHDFRIRRGEGVPVLMDERYLIQYRSPVFSIVSNYLLFRRNHPFQIGKWSWKLFARMQIDFWNKFVDKWVLDFPADATPPLFCSYESLLANPEDRVNEVLAFLCDGALDDEAVASAKRDVPIVRGSRLKEFKYYDPGFFKELEEATSGRIERLKLPSFADDG